MLWLLFRPELPSAEEAGLLEQIAVALANPVRETQRSMQRCAQASEVAGSSVLDGGLVRRCGAPGWWKQDVLAAMQRWALLPPLGTGLSASDWLRFWREGDDRQGRTGLQADHLAGFDPNGRGPHGVVAQALAGLAAVSCTPRLTWLVEHQADLESATGVSLTMSGVAAAAFVILD